MLLSISSERVSEGVTYQFKVLINFLQKEKQQLRAKEEELADNVKLLQSQLENEQSERKILEESIDMVSKKTNGGSKKFWRLIC